MKKIFTWYWDKLGSSKNGIVTFFSGAAFFIIPVIIIKPICQRSVFIVIFILITQGIILMNLRYCIMLEAGI